MKNRYIWILGTVAIICFSVGLILRLLPVDKVFTENGIKFSTLDAYYFQIFTDDNTKECYAIYQIDNPERTTVSPSEIVVPAYSTFLKQSYGESDATAAIIPVIAFVLCAMLIFAITYQSFFNTGIACIATAIYCILPGETMMRTSIGSGDRHAAEMALMFCILGAIMLLKEKTDKKNIAWNVIIILQILTLLTAYMLIWQGSIILPVILLLFVIILIVQKQLEKHNVRHSGIISLLIIPVSIILAIPFNQAASYMFGIDTTTFYNESMPLFSTQGRIDLATAWNYYGITLYLGLIGIGMAAYQYTRNKNKHLLLFLTWSIVMLALTLASRRYDYYFGISVAIFSAYCVYTIGKIIMTTQYRKVQVIFIAVVLIAVPLIRTGYMTATSTAGFIPDKLEQATLWLRQQHNIDYTVPDKKKPINGVLSHRDYGYWIAYNSLLPPLVSANGKIDREQVAATILTETDDKAALLALQEQKIKYIMIDKSMLTDRLYPIFVMAGIVQAGQAITAQQVDNSLMLRLYYSKGVEGLIEVYRNEEVVIYENTNHSL